MGVADALSPPGDRWVVRNGPASRTAVRALADAAPFRLPEAYFDLLRLINGAEGELALAPGWFQLWPAEEVLQHNAGYEVEQWHPRHFGFGTSGGGVLFAFRRDDDRVHGIPFDSIDPEDATLVASTFRDFIAAMGVRHDGAVDP